MMDLYISGFRVNSIEEYNAFIRRILFMGESYLKFLISKNKIFLPVHIEPKDAAVDLLAEIFTQENNILIKFKDFFENNLSDSQIQSEEDFEKYLRGFLYTVIRNNLINIYRDNDPVTYNIYRNIKETVKSLNYCISIHFSDKYIQTDSNLNFTDPIPEKEDLINLVYSKGLAQEVINIRRFIELLFNELNLSNRFSPLIRLSDLAGVIKSILVSNLSIRTNGHGTNDLISGNLNVKFTLESVRYAFIEKLDKYAFKNKLSKNFLNSMYCLTEEVMGDLSEGNKRKSVLELQKMHFQSEDKTLFNKVQYCVEMLEEEITKQYNKEQKLIGGK